MIYHWAEMGVKKTRSEEERTADRLHSAMLHLLRRLRRVDASSGLNAPRLSALAVIVFAGPITLGGLAEAEQVRPPTMTRIVNALEQQGLVTKRGDAEDGRTIRLSATMKGRRVLVEGRNRRINLLAGQIASLRETDGKTLRAAIEILDGIVERI